MSSLIHSFAKVGGNTLVSRLLGFVRDLLIARLFGATAATDAFLVAFRLPTLLRRLFAEGAFALVLVPWLHEWRRAHSAGEFAALLDRLTGTLAATTLVMTLLGVLTAPLLILILAPGFAAEPQQAALATSLLRLTLPYAVFIALTALAGAILNLHGRFGIAAFTPALLNLSLIASALWLAPRLAEPIEALAWGVVLGGAVQLALQWSALARLGWRPRARLAFGDARLRALARRLPPALLAVSVAPLSFILDALLASWLESGSISWLYYAERLMEFPLGLLASALGIVILPQLSARQAEADPSAMRATLEWALRWVVLLGVPAAVGLIVLAGPLMVTLFASDAFGAEDARMAAQALSAYALGLAGFMALKVLAPAYYARHDHRSPLRMALLALGANLVLSLVLMRPLGHAGLALGTALAAWLNAALLLGGLWRADLLRVPLRWVWLLARGLGASVLMGVVVALGAGSLERWIACTQGERLLHLALWIGSGALVYALALLLAGIRPRHLRSP